MEEMHMKHFKMTALAACAVLAFGFAACSSDDDSSINNNNGNGGGGNTTYTVTVNAADNGTVTADKTSAAAGATVTLTLSASEGYEFGTISVKDAANADVATTAVTAGTKYTFTMPAGNVTVTATFKSTASGGDDTPTTTTYTVTIANGIENGTVTASPTNAAAGTEVTLTVTPGSGYELDTLAVTDASNNTVTVTDNKFTMPESNVTVSATFKGTSTNPTYIGTKAPSEAKAVGDIVFSDGSATPYTSGLTLTDTQKAAAIAVIFYVGTELNSGDDTTTSRTLGVGLAHNTSGLAWCTSGANAYIKNIATIQCPASGNAGALTFTGDKNGSDNLSQIGTFLSSNSSTDDTATEANYPAFYYAKNYASQTGSHVASTDYASDWYLPSIAELFQVWKSRETVNAAIEACGGTKFNLSYCYWSSSQYSSFVNFACYLSFYDGDWDKYDGYGGVCAVRAFN